MKKGETGRPGRKQSTLNVDLGQELLYRVEELRRSISDGCEPPRRLTLGDVVRLGLRLLDLRVMLNDWDCGARTKADWQRVLVLADSIEQTGPWPAFLLLPLAHIAGMGAAQEGAAKSAVKRARPGKPKK